jgi:replicative DNA helicase
LGALLLAPDSFAVANEIIRPEDFYVAGHRDLYRVLYKMAEIGCPIDLVTVTEALLQQGLLEQVGGVGYLASLAGAVPSAVNIGYYARIVAEKGLLRSIVSTCSQLAAKGYDEGVEGEQLLDEAERMVLELGTRRQGRSYRSLRELLHEALERIEKLYQNRGGGVTGLTTGYTDLDELTGGLQPSDLILLAARPSMGKTSLALNIARNVALSKTMPVPVLVFSLEMSNDQVAQRLLCSEARVSQTSLRRASPGQGGCGPGGGAHLRGRYSQHFPLRDAQQGAPASGGAQCGPDRGRLPATHAAWQTDGEPGSGDLRNLPLPEISGPGTGRPRAGPVAAQPGSGAAQRQKTDVVGPERER